MDSFLQDLRYTLRGLRRSPAFTLVALLTLALGIGINASIFGIVNAILFRPLPVEAPGQLVDIYGHTATSSTHDTHSYPNFLDYRAQTKTLSTIIGYSDFFAHLSVAGSSEIVIGEIVTDGYFQTLGVTPRLGRAFGPDEYVAEGASPVAVVSDAFWRKRFAADPNIIGRSFRLNGITYTVVGVAPPNFGGMIPAVTSQMWIPTSMVEHVETFGNQRVSGTSTGTTRFQRRGQHWLWLKGRMKPGVTVAQVRADLASIATRLGTAYAETNALERIAVVPTKDVRINPDLDGPLTAAGLVLTGAVGLVLIVACANLANLMLARAAGRRREYAIRVALGANRGRMTRQLLMDSIVLALAGGMVALPLAAAFATVVSKVQPPLPIDINLTIGPDWRVLVFTFASAVLTGIAFGLIPGLRASRPDLVPALKSGAATSTGRKARLELRDALVVVQMTVSVVLVVAGAMLVRSLSIASRVDLGYDSDRLAALSLALEMSGYDRDRGGRFLESARERLTGLPQVENVSLTSRAPMSLNNNGFGMFIDGRQASASDEPFTIDGAYVDERYFDALQLPLVSGRAIEAADRRESRRVAVVTKGMAEKFWPGQDALGREFRLRWGAEPYRIVGVVADYKVNTPGERATPYIHLPLGMRESYADVIVRTRAPARGVVATLQRELRVLDPDLVFLNAGTIRDLVDVRLFPVRAGAWLIGAFGALALAVAAVGLYGVVGYSVSRRVREIGIRKALGARPAELLTMVLSEGMRLVAVGGVVGALLAALGARFLSSVLYVGSFDAGSFAIAFGVLAAVAVVANVVPARRAARVDPMVTLRQE